MENNQKLVPRLRQRVKINGTELKKENMDTTKSQCERMLNDGIHHLLLHVWASDCMTTDFGWTVAEQRRVLMHLGDQLFRDVRMCFHGQASKKNIMVVN